MSPNAKDFLKIEFFDQLFYPKYLENTAIFKLFFAVLQNSDITEEICIFEKSFALRITFDTRKTLTGLGKSVFDPCYLCAMQRIFSKSSFVTNFFIQNVSKTQPFSSCFSLFYKILILPTKTAFLKNPLLCA